VGGHWKRAQRTRGERRPAPRNVTVRLEPSEFAIVTRTISGTGGHQGLLLRLMGKLRGDGRLELSTEEVDQIRRYAEAYGAGGFQDRFKVLVAAIERELETRGNRGDRA